MEDTPRPKPRRVAVRRNKPVPQRIEPEAEDDAKPTPLDLTSALLRPGSQLVKPPSPYPKLMAASPRKAHMSPLPQEKGEEDVGLPSSAPDESSHEMEVDSATLDENGKENSSGTSTLEQQPDNSGSGGDGEDQAAAAEPEEVEMATSIDKQSAATPKPKKKREAYYLKMQLDKWTERSMKQQKKKAGGLTQLQAIATRQTAQRRRMQEQQRQEREEGKMSGISLSLPRAWAAQQAAGRARQGTLKKLRSQVGMQLIQDEAMPKTSAYTKGLLDTAEAAEERERLCKECINRINTKIEARFASSCLTILFTVDASLLGNIKGFVQSSARSTQTTGPVDDLDALLASLNKPAKLEIPTALLFVGVNVPDHERLFGQVVRALQEDGQRVASLRSKDCKMTLKNIIKLMVTQFIGSNPLYPVKSGKANMRTLQYWYKTKGWSDQSTEAEHTSTSTTPSMEPPLVVLIEDFEAFNAEILKELISIIGYYQTEIQFVLVLGLATSTDALHRVFPRSVSVRLSTHKFTFHSSRESFEDIFKQIVINSDTGMHLGYKTVEWIRESFYTWNLSIQTLQRELQLATIEHFCGNALGFLCRSEHDDAYFAALDQHLGPFQLLHVRDKKSVKQEVEALRRQATKPSQTMIHEWIELKKKRMREALNTERAAKAKEAEESAASTDVATDESTPAKLEESGDAMEVEDQSVEEIEIEVTPPSEDEEEWELMQKDDDYLRVCASHWIDNIRRYHRNMRAVRECAATLIARIRTSPTTTVSDELRTDVFLSTLPNANFFRMMSGKSPMQRLGQALLPVRSAFVNSQLFLTAMGQIKLLVTELEPLMHILVEFQAILSNDPDFQPFDLDYEAPVPAAEDGQESSASLSRETLPVSGIQKSGDENRKILMGELQRLIDRLAARVEACSKQSEEGSASSLPSSASSTPLRRSVAGGPQASPFTPRSNLRKGTSSKRIAAWIESWQGDIEQQLKQDVQNFLVRFFRLISSQLPAYCLFPLHEVFYYNRVDELDESFNAAPLTTIKDALRNPKAYLDSSRNAWPANPIDTSVTFELYQSAGKMINLKDWFDSFCERMKPGFFEYVGSAKSGGRKAPKKGTKRKATSSRTAKRKDKEYAADKDEEAEDDGKTAEKQEMPDRIITATVAEQAQLLGRFFTAISELQMIGFVCPSLSRRQEILAKMALGGATA